MLQKSPDERIASMLHDTITLFCKSGIDFKQKFTIEGVIGITVDDNNVILVSISEIVCATSSSCEQETDVEPKRKDAANGEQPMREDGEDQEGSNTDKFNDDNLKLGSDMSDVESESSTDIVFIKQELVDDSWPDCGDTLPELEEIKETVESKEQTIDVPSTSDSGLPPINTQQQQQQRWPSINHDPPTTPATEVNTKSFICARMLSANKTVPHPSIEGGTPQQGSEIHQLMKSRRSKSYKCKFCQKLFKTERYRKTHENAHRGIYPYTCNICYQGILTSGHLKSHLNKHKSDANEKHRAGERQGFLCQRGSVFTDDSQLCFAVS